MSRNLTVQLAIAALLGLVLIAILIQIVQYDNIESSLIDVRQRTEHNETLLTQLKETVERGVRAEGTNPEAPTKTTKTTKTAAVVAGNLLTIDPVPMVADGAKLDGELRVPYTADFKGFNRVVEKDSGVQELYRGLIGDQLARRHIKDSAKWHGQLATSITVSDDKKSYHVKLRSGVMYHKPAVDWSNPRYKWLEGDHEVTSDDFAFAMEIIMNPQVEGAAPMRTYFEDFDRIEVLGPYEFKVHWKKAYALSLPSTVEFFPMPRWLYSFDEDGRPYPPETLGLKLNGHWYNDRGIGTGPFAFVEIKPGEFLKLTRNDSYYGGAPALKGILIKIVKDRNQSLLQFKKGELDFTALSPTQYRKEILDDPQSKFNTGEFKYDFYVGLNYFYMGWNGDGPFFNDRRTRLAMTHAFNREKILTEVFQGLGKVISGNFHFETPYYDPALEPHPFDLEKSAALLDEAGWKDTDGDGIRDKVIDGEKRDFEFRFLIFNSSAEYKTMVDIFKEDLIKVGVRMIIIPLDWPAMQKKMDDKEFDGFTGGWGLNLDPDPYQLWHSSGADIPKGSNRVGFRNKEADAIIMEARTTFDLDKRVALFRRFHKILYDEQPYTFFFTPKSVVAWTPRLHNVTFQKDRPQILYRLMWLDK